MRSANTCEAKKIFVMTLFLVSNGGRFSKASESSPTRWFKTYENVSASIDFFTETGRVSFIYYGEQFLITFQTRNIVSDYLGKVYLNSWPVTFPLSRSNVVLYEGFTTKPFRSKAMIKIIGTQLDIMFHTPNDTLILEPISRYFHSVKPCFVTSKTVYRNIIYKGSDVMTNLNSKQLLWSSFNKNNKAYAEFKRKKRQTVRNNTECTLYVAVDHVYFEKTAGKDVQRTIAEITYFVSETNQVFRSTDFNGDGAGDAIGFRISKIQIYNATDYLMASKTADGDYLDAFSEYNFDDYCVATAFTSKEFGSTLGLAWTASSNVHGSLGGICQKRTYISSKYLSLNTNFVTNHNRGALLPTYLTALTLAHELGHSFGSPHDPEDNKACVPEGADGNFLMYPYSSPGNEPNNNLFSTCSINYINPVIQNKGSCLQAPAQASCGNGKVENGEECDCGTSSICLSVDPCCTPSDVNASYPDKPCTYRRSWLSECSPINSVCCTNECKYVPASENVVCKYGSDCTYPSTCNGTSGVCPDVVNVEDLTPCAKDRRSCYQGKCMGSICQTYGMDHCLCTGDLACYICCKTNWSICTPLSNQQHKHSFRRPGESCNNRKGFCDYNGKCVQMDEESTLDRLMHMFTRENVESFIETVKEHWYYIVLSVVAFGIFVTVFIVTYREGNNVQTSAYMYGRFVQIQREAELQKAYLIKRRKSVAEVYRKKINRLEKFALKRSLPKAVARLMVFFPTVQPKVIIHTLKSSANESICIKWLLIKNYPFRKFYKPDLENENNGTARGTETIVETKSADDQEIKKAKDNKETAETYNSPLLDDDRKGEKKHSLEKQHEKGPDNEV